MATKPIGILVLIIAIWLLWFGIRYKGSYVSKVRFIGTSLLLGVLGVYLILEKRSFCEVFFFIC